MKKEGVLGIIILLIFFGGLIVFLNLALPEARFSPLEPFDEASKQERISYILENGRDIVKSGEIVSIILDDFDNERGETEYYLLDEKRNYYRVYFQEEPDLISSIGVSLNGKAVNEEIVPFSYDIESPLMPIGGQIQPPSIGEQRTAVVMVNFLDAQEEPQTVEEMEEVVFNSDNPASMNSYFQEFSFDNFWLSGEVYGWFTLPVFDEDCGDYIGDAQNPTPNNTVNFIDPFIDFSQYDALMIYFYNEGEEPNCPKLPNSSGGLVSFETDEGITYLSWTTIPSIVWGFVPKYGLHEMGHNLWLSHASDMECGEEVVGGVGYGCSSIEYGNKYNVMGPPNGGHYDTVNKEHLNWIDSSNVDDISFEEDGIFVLRPIEASSNGLQALKIPAEYHIYQGFYSSHYYIEYRKAIGLDGSPNFPELVGDGLLHVTLNMDSSHSRSHLLDMTPHITSEEYSQAQDSSDALLAPGKIFHDPNNDISIKFASAIENGAVVLAGWPLACVNYVSIETCIRCPDINNNEIVEVEDRTELLQFEGFCEGDSEFKPEYDLDGDGCVTSIDATECVLPFLGMPTEEVSTCCDFLDVISPEVQITSPEDGSLVSEVIMVQVEADDYVGVNYVDLLLQGVPIATDNEEPFEFSLDTTQYENGQYELIAQAYDPSENLGEDFITIFIDNFGPITCIGDLDLDGFVDIEDLLILLTGWGTPDGDVDDDGDTDTEDLLILISNWGPCGGATSAPSEVPKEAEDTIKNYLGNKFYNKEFLPKYNAMLSSN